MHHKSLILNCHTMQRGIFESTVHAYVRQTLRTEILYALIRAVHSNVRFRRVVLREQYACVLFLFGTDRITRRDRSFIRDAETVILLDHGPEKSMSNVRIYRTNQGQVLWNQFKHLNKSLEDVWQLIEPDKSRDEVMRLVSHTKAAVARVVQEYIDDCPTTISIDVHFESTPWDVLMHLNTQQHDVESMLISAMLSSLASGLDVCEDNLKLDPSLNALCLMYVSKSCILALANHVYGDLKKKWMSEYQGHEREVSIGSTVFRCMFYQIPATHYMNPRGINYVFSLNPHVDMIAFLQIANHYSTMQYYVRKDAPSLHGVDGTDAISGLNIWRTQFRCSDCSLVYRYSKTKHLGPQFAKMVSVGKTFVEQDTDELPVLSREIMAFAEESPPPNAHDHEDLVEEVIQHLKKTRMIRPYHWKIVRKCISKLRQMRGSS